MITKGAMFYLASIGFATALACVQVDVSFANGEPTCNMKGAQSLSAPLELQQTSQWCWAAATRTVMNYNYQKRGSSTPIEEQCKMVNRKIGEDPASSYCCEVRQNQDLIIPPIECYVGGWPNEVLAVYNFHTKPIPMALNWKTLTQEICLDRPFLYVRVRCGGTHVLIVLGYSYSESPPDVANPAPTNYPDGHLNPEKEWVEIYDPTHKNFEFVQYDEFVGDKPGVGQTYGYRHYSDYIQIYPE